MKHRISTVLLLILSAGLAQTCLAQQAELKLYIFNNGHINGLDPELFNFREAEVKNTDFIVTSNLIVHPDGILLWDAGATPDALFPEDGSPLIEGVLVAEKTLRAQLAEIGYRPEDIDYFAMSHLHSDHNGNANEFAGAHLLIQKADHDFMFSENPQGIINPDHYDQLRNAKTTMLDNEDFDVFGDGTVRIISTPGHTPGHQVLLVNLANTGPVLLAGDLYHYPEEINSDRFPGFEFSTRQSAQSRAKVTALLEQTGAQMWISHDIATFQKLQFSPAFYE